MFDDEDIEVLDLDNPSTQNIPEKNKNIAPTNKDKKNDNILTNDIEILTENISDNTNKNIKNDNKDTKKNYNRQKIIIVPKRPQTKTTKQINKTNLNSGYVIILSTIIIVIMLMTKMMIDIEDKHTTKTSNQKTIEQSQNINTNKHVICTLNDETNSNINTTRKITFTTTDDKIKEVTTEETLLYKAKDDLYQNKILECSTTITQYNSYNGYEAKCNIDENESTITTTKTYQLEQLDSNTINILNPPILPNSNIQEIINNYKIGGYTCNQ